MTLNAAATVFKPGQRQKSKKDREVTKRNIQQAAHFSAEIPISKGQHFVDDSEVLGGAELNPSTGQIYQIVSGCVKNAPITRQAKLAPFAKTSHKLFITAPAEKVLKAEKQPAPLLWNFLLFDSRENLAQYLRSCIVL